MFTTEQKTQLAKLLATENLAVQHQKISTAKFDPTNRILYLPVWQNMSGSLYDLLVGHEVGHALYTPAEGWHDAVTGPDSTKNYKHFLNVVEDARIEKKVQRKYPGLKKHFAQAYKELIDRDFFGTKGLSPNNLSFIDRLNLFSKSQWSNQTILFTDEETKLVKKVQAVETWDDVLKVTKAVFDYSKDEQKQMKIEQFDQMMTEGFDEESQDDYEIDDSYDQDGMDGEEYGDENESNSTEENVDENKDQGSKSEFDRYKESKSSWEDQFAPECQTDKQFREKENTLLDEKCKDIVYLSIPKPVLNNIVTPAKRVHELHDQYMDEYIANGWVKPNATAQLLQEFKNRNDRYIGLLAKEFEMRKAARAYNKSKISDTGDIDINKLASYKFDENIFRKMMVTPKGKSHGLVLLLDKSGSMSNNMAGSIEQILVLTMFCRKVNIPFVVYGFGCSETVKLIDIGNDVKQRLDEKKYYYSNFSQEIGDLGLGKVFLREYLNSKMSNAEFTRAMKHMLAIKKSFENGRSRGYDNHVLRFPTEDLSNTPLVEALVATAEIMKDFKKSNNLDITNLVIVHDGDADGTNRYFTLGKNYMTGAPEKKYMYFDHKYKNYFLQDVKNKFENQIVDKNRNNIYDNVLTWFTKTTDSKIFGFFICDSYRGSTKTAIEGRLNVDGVPVYELKQKDLFAAQNIVKEKMKILRSEKFLETNSFGFESFFLIAGGNELDAEDEGLEVEANATTKTLVKAFTKMNKKKAVNRVLVSRFIQGIAA